MTRDPRKDPSWYVLDDQEEEKPPSWLAVWIIAVAATAITIIVIWW